MDSAAVSFFRFDEAEPLVPFDGVEMRAVFGAAATLNLVRLAPGAAVAEHSHPHEQLGMVLEGGLALILTGAEHALAPGQAYVIPGGVRHGARGGPEGCLALDVFVPTREDYRAAAAPALAGLR